MLDNCNRGHGKTIWKTSTEENISAFFRCGTGAFFCLSFIIMPIMIRLPGFKFLDGGIGKLIWLLAPIPIGLWLGRSRTYTFDSITAELTGPGYTQAVQSADVSRYSVPAPENDLFIGWGLQVMVYSFFMAPFYKGEFVLHMKNGSRKSIHFAKNETAHDYFTWFQAQLENPRSHE